MVGAHERSNRCLTSLVSEGPDAVGKQEPITQLESQYIQCRRTAGATGPGKKQPDGIDGSFSLLLLRPFGGCSSQSPLFYK